MTWGTATAGSSAVSRLLWVSALLGTVALTVLIVGAMGASGQTYRPAHVRTSAQAIFQRDCAVCHGNTARGSNRGPSLVGSGAAALDFWLSTGRMPLRSPSETPSRHTPSYDPATIRALISYIQSLTGPGGPPIPMVDLRNATLSTGGEFFRVQCAACHSWAGEGGALLSRAAPPTSHASPTQIFEAIRTGPGAMPRFGQAALSDREVNDVVAYVQYLNHPLDRGGNPLGRIGPLAEGAAALVIGLGLMAAASRWIGTRG